MTEFEKALARVALTAMLAIEYQAAGRCHALISARDKVGALSDDELYLAIIEQSDALSMVGG